VARHWFQDRLATRVREDEWLDLGVSQGLSPGGCATSSNRGNAPSKFICMTVKII
jgi:hypothetical protein